MIWAVNQRLNAFLSKYVSMKTVSQFKKYFVTGLISFGIEYIVYVLLYSLFGKWKPDFYFAFYGFFGDVYLRMAGIPLTEDAYRSAFVNIPIYIFVFWFVFLMNRNWSFQSKQNVRRQLFYFLVLFLFNLFFANIYLLLFFTNVLFIHPLFAKILVVGLCVSWNFVIYKKFIYKN